jgi:hypothetical protein
MPPQPQPSDLLALALPTSAELTDITSAAVHGSVRRPDAHATPIPYDWGSPATAGLWRVEIRDGLRQDELCCTYFVKLLRHPRLWPGLSDLPDEASRREFVDFFPWRFELDMYGCGIGSVLPAGMRMPVLHHVKHADPDHIGLWWEYVAERPGRWELADYQRAARLLGQLAARRRDGAEINLSLPKAAREAHPDGSALRFFTERRVMRGALPALQNEQVWGHPLTKTALHRAGDPALPADLLVLGARLRQILDMLDALPQTYAHGDASPQNLLRPAGEPETVVVIDWGFGTLLPVGFDLGQLLVGLAHAGETEPSELRDIDAAIFPAYLDGLAAEGYDVASQVVRAGYLGALAARSALCALPIELLTSAAPTEEAEVLFLKRLQLTRVLVDMAAEIQATGPSGCGSTSCATRSAAVRG